MPSVNQDFTLASWAAFLGKGKLPTYPRVAYKSSDGRSQPKSKQENQPVAENDLYNYWRGVWGDDESEKNYEKAIHLQDVCSRGPLFELPNIPLNEDREAAKQQWHYLCVEHEQKRKIAMDLWEENQSLKNELKYAEETSKTLRESLDWAYQGLRQLGAENRILTEEIRRITWNKKSSETEPDDDLDI
ncbi:hypothetical protein F5Y09DRAFT_339080 [Xylaria sp. FL1042]|nr:hypothetical protein F5Y09DRAFT_339080 [Xylaria sp. FL1042]